jgi:3-oxoacyl-[acyl-carrier-protein] synthase II
VSNAPAAITGWGAVSPLGVGATTLFESWRDGVSGLDGGMGVCDEFDPAVALSKKEIRRTDRFVQMGVVAFEEAVQAAWPDGCPYDLDRVACIMGAALGSMRMIEDQHKVLKEHGPMAVSPLTIPVFMANALPATICIRNGFRGECSCICSACASSAQAIGAGLHLLRRGDADAVVVGGAESSLTELTRAAFGTARALSPTGISRPFDRRRDGFVLAEGAGVLIIERPEDASRRGAEVIGEVLGYASTNDANHITAPEENGASAALAMRLALDDAGIEPWDVDYVNAHGTSTPLNDRSEVLALKTAFGEAVEDLPVSSTKSVTGHSLGAAGAVEAVATLECLRRRTAAPTVGLEDPDDGLDLNFVPGGPQPIAKRRQNGSRAGAERVIAASNSFAFGGHNATLVFAA